LRGWGCRRLADSRDAGDGSGFDRDRRSDADRRRNGDRGCDADGRTDGWFDHDQFDR
jgi:hypothetical protein